MKHPFDRILAKDDELGPEAEMVWIEMKDTNPKLAWSLWNKHKLRPYLMDAEKRVRKQAQDMMDEGVGEAEAWEIARDEAMKSVHPAEESREEEAFLNLAPASDWMRALLATPEEQDAEMKRLIQMTEEENARRDRERLARERKRASEMPATT